MVERDYAGVRRRRGLSWEQMAELAERDGQPEAAAVFRSRARLGADCRPSAAVTFFVPL